jgi:hypothetical protein
MSSNEQELTEDDLTEVPSQAQRDRLRDGAYERRVEKRRNEVEQINDRRRQEAITEAAKQSENFSEDDFTTEQRDGRIVTTLREEAALRRQAASESELLEPDDFQVVEGDDGEPQVEPTSEAQQRLDAIETIANVGVNFQVGGSRDFSLAQLRPPSDPSTTTIAVGGDRFTVNQGSRAGISPVFESGADAARFFSALEQLDVETRRQLGPSDIQRAPDLLERQQARAARSEARQQLDERLESEGIDADSVDTDARVGEMGEPGFIVGEDGRTRRVETTVAAVDAVEEIREPDPRGTRQTSRASDPETREQVSRQEVEQVQIGDETLSETQARERIASGLEDASAEDVRFEGRGDETQTLVDGQPIEERQREQVASEVGVEPDAVSLRDDGAVEVETSALEERLREQAAESFERNPRRVLAGTESIPLGVDIGPDDLTVDNLAGDSVVISGDGGVDAEIRLNEETRQEIQEAEQRDVRNRVAGTTGVDVEDVQVQEDGSVRVADEALEEQAQQEAAEETAGADAEDFVADVSREETDDGTEVSVDVRRRDAPLFEDQREAVVETLQDAPGGAEVPGPLGTTITVPTGDNVEAAPEEGDAPLPEGAEGTVVEEILQEAGAVTEDGERVSVRSALRTADEGIRRRTSGRIRRAFSDSPNVTVPGPLGSAVTIRDTRSLAEAPATAIEFLNPASTARFAVGVAEQGVDMAQAQAVDRVEATREITEAPTETTTGDIQQLVAPGTQSGTRTQAENAEVGQQVLEAGGAISESAQSDPRGTTFQAIGATAALLGGGFAASRIRGRIRARRESSGSGTSASSTSRAFLRDERASGQLPRGRDGRRSKEQIDGDDIAPPDNYNPVRPERQRVRRAQKETERTDLIDASSARSRRNARRERIQQQARERFEEPPRPDFSETTPAVRTVDEAGGGGATEVAPTADVVERDRAVSEPEVVVEQDVVEADGAIQADGVVAEETTDEIQQRQEDAAEPEVIVEEDVIEGSETVVEPAADVTADTRGRQEQAQAPSVTGAMSLEGQQDDLLVSDQLADLDGFNVGAGTQGDVTTGVGAADVLDVGVGSVVGVDTLARTQAQARLDARARESQRSRQRQRSQERPRNRRRFPRIDPDDSDQSTTSTSGISGGIPSDPPGSDSTIGPNWFAENLEAAAEAPLSERSGLAPGASAAASGSVLGGFGLPTAAVAEAQESDSTDSITATAAAFNLDIGDREGDRDDSGLFGGFFS